MFYRLAELASRFRRASMLIVLAAASIGGGALTAQTTAPAPLPNAGFEEGTPGEAPAFWLLGGPGQNYRVVLDTANPHQGRTSARLSRIAGAPPGGSDFGALAAQIDAAPYRGKRIRYSAAVRVRPGQAGRTGLWLRVDRGTARGFFDNMHDRPITAGDWTVYSIEGDVAPDATAIFLGLLLTGEGEAWIDSASLEIVGEARSPPPPPVNALPPRPRAVAGPYDAPPRELSARGLDNLRAFARAYGYVRFFHPSDQAAAADWNRIAIDGVEAAERARGPAELARALNAIFRPVAPSFSAFVTSAAPLVRAPPPPRPGAQALAWTRTGFADDPVTGYSGERTRVPAVGREDILSQALPGGVTVQVPLRVWTDAEGRTLPHRAPAPPHSSKPAEFLPSGFDRSTRLAATVIAWNIFQHFYPYRDVVPGSWADALDDTLRGAATDPDDIAFRNRLRRLVAAAHDGHGSIAYSLPARGQLPLAWAWVEGRLVVTATGEENGGIARGDVVMAIGGRPVEAALADIVAMRSGSPQWRRYTALLEMLSGPARETVEIAFTDAGGAPRRARIAYRPVAGPPVREPRPAEVAELEPGILYVDLSRTPAERLRAADTQMAAARGIVFDLRGYPRGPPWILSRLTGTTIRSPSFDRPTYTRPDQASATFRASPWTIEPQTPRYTSNVVFLTDESAISYSESILGTVKGNRLGRIVGAPTAGANGNIAQALLPGGYRMVWTGMRVVNLDGSPHHLTGVLPDVPVARTIAGIRAGRDELLERAVQELRASR